MPERIRFRFDEHVDPDVARALRRCGIDATTTVEAGLRTQSDLAHWEFAHRERRVVLTHDAGFLRTASRQQDHYGLTYCHKTARTIGEIIRTQNFIHHTL
jgi:predicted nuclease of predicted toxin-antitoxin system